MAERSCLICGVTETEVIAVRSRDRYTLGCGIESDTENGFDYDELSPRHRWAPWRDGELDRMGIKPEAYDRYRTATTFEIQYAACIDTKHGHAYVTEHDRYSPPVGTCWGCGAQRPTGSDNEGLRPGSNVREPARCTHEGGEWPGLDRCADCGQPLGSSDRGTS